MNKILWIIFAIAVLLLILSGPLGAQDKVSTHTLKIRKIEGTKNGKTKVHIGDTDKGKDDSGIFYNMTFSKKPNLFVNQILIVVPRDHYKLLVYNDKKYTKLSNMLFEVFDGDTANLKIKILGSNILQEEKGLPAKELKGIW